MAVYNAKSKEQLPSDAIVLSPDEAALYQWKVIVDWKPQSEVWALRLTPGILGAMSAASGMVINNHFRGKLKLGAYGRMSTYLPIVILPAVASMLYHKAFVQKLILLDIEGCPVCTQLRATSFQSVLGVGYPIALGPFAAFMFATRYYTYRLPSVTENPKEVFALIRKLGRPLVPFLGAALIGQSLITMYLTYMEMMQFYKLQITLQGAEKAFESDS